MQWHQNWMQWLQIHRIWCTLQSSPWFPPPPLPLPFRRERIPGWSWPFVPRIGSSPSELWRRVFDASTAATPLPRASTTLRTNLGKREQKVTSQTPWERGQIEGRGGGRGALGRDQKWFMLIVTNPFRPEWSLRLSVCHFCPVFGSKHVWPKLCEIHYCFCLSKAPHNQMKKFSTLVSYMAKLKISRNELMP